MAEGVVDGRVELGRGETLHLGQGLDEADLVRCGRVVAGAGPGLVVRCGLGPGCWWWRRWFRRSVRDWGDGPRLGLSGGIESALVTFDLLTEGLVRQVVVLLDPLDDGVGVVERGVDLAFEVEGEAGRVEVGGQLAAEADVHAKHEFSGYGRSNISSTQREKDASVGWAWPPPSRFGMVR